MSKPSIPGELRGVDVQFVSLVSKAANGKKFQIFKGVDGPEPQEEPSEKGLFRLLKDFFSGHWVEKGEMAERFKSEQRREGFWKAVDALAATLNAPRWAEDKKADEATVDAATVSSALADFTAIVSGLFAGGNAAIIKAGRKISAARLAALKDAHGLLASIIAEAEEAPKEGGTEVTKEEIQAIVKGAIDETLKPIAEKLESLEKGDDTKPEQKAEPITAEAVKGLVVEAVKGAIEPLASRLETVEKARGLSNGLPSSGNESQTKTVEKSVFGGAFTGHFSE